MEIYNLQQISLFLSITCLLFDSFIDCVQNCHFPDEYKGTWYQQGLGTFNITRTELGKKGVCYRKLHTAYIIYNRGGDCYRCMVITRSHHNALQYKESFCLAYKNLGTLCSLIHGNARLYTLIREPATPIPCIFQGSYTFSYTNGSGLMCDKPMSSLSACASDAHYRFHFRRCKNVPDSHDKVYDFKCLARWTSGGKYMIGRFESENMWHKMYRCFIYEDPQPGQPMRVAMSLDASCIGLVNTDDGPAVLELNKERATANHRETACTFPDWLSAEHAKWHDLSSRTIYHVDSGSKTIRVYHKPQHHIHKRLTDKLKCYQLDEPNTTEKLFQAISETTTSECETKYQCIRIFQRSVEVVEFHRGRPSSSLRDICDEGKFRRGTKNLLIPTKLTGNRCPFDGRYDVEISQSNNPTCRSTFSSGCGDSSHLKVELSTCPSSIISDSSLTCLSSWSHNKTTYVIVKKVGSRGGGANCFSFVEKDDSIMFSLDKACNMGTTPIVDKQIQYKLRGTAGSCNQIVSKGSATVHPPDKNTKYSAGTGSTGANTASSSFKNSVAVMTSCLALFYILLTATIDNAVTWS
ncbi:uncharacterized protein LOC141899596 [Tubulanus polymorphus]|uniref:uncharacterized protein LOC141899596 n=1 Tax=Tubulanus polymorphus TaxID=672921 RepID=UPI003DA42295